MDHMGCGYLDAHLDLLKKRGRLVFINSATGNLGQLDYDRLIVKRIYLIGSVLRSRPLAEKALIAHDIREKALPLIQRSKLKPAVDQVFPLEKAEHAFARLVERKNLGKIVLRVQ